MSERKELELPSVKGFEEAEYAVREDEQSPDYTLKELGDPVIEVYDLTKSYVLEGGVSVPALRGINLHSNSEFDPIRRGEFVMVRLPDAASISRCSHLCTHQIRGPSGGGKTTLLNMIGTIDSPTEGTISLFGERVNFAKATDKVLADLRLRRIGFVFQTFNLLATLSAFENVELPMSVLGYVLLHIPESSAITIHCSQKTQP